VTPQARNRLLAQGLARGIVWRDGKLPEGAPDFPEALTEDLLDFGYGVLAIALELSEANVDTADFALDVIVEAFRVAAEAIESATRRGASDQPLRGFHLLLAAASFHLGGHPARSYSLVARSVSEETLGASEQAFSLLLRHLFFDLRRHVISTLSREAYSDNALSARLVDQNDGFSAEDAAAAALSILYHRALGLLDTALITGREEIFDIARTRLQALRDETARIGNVPIWWLATLTHHLLGHLRTTSLHQRIPGGDAFPSSWNDIRLRYIQLQAARLRPALTLWPSQIEAANRAANPDDDLVIALPTSAGKTRIAELCILRCLADSKRVVYVTPLRALSAQVERTLARTFVPLNASVTSLYGAAGVTLTDIHTLVDASIVVATPEKLDFALRQDPHVLDDVGLVVFDEGHMIGVGSREIRYEVLIQRLLRRSDSSTRRIVCLSAMFNPEDESVVDFAAWLRSDEAGEPVHVHWRPTRQLLATLQWSSSKSARLTFVEGEKPFVPRFIEEQPPMARRRNPFPQNDKEFCIAAANAFAKEGDDVLVYSPQRRQVEPLVRDFCRIAKQGYLTGIRPPEDKAIRIAHAIGLEWLGEDHAAMVGLKFGIGTHHGALPRPFLSALEDLLLRRQLPVVVASPTLAQGIDLSCRVLLFRSIHRFDAELGEQQPIEAAEFSNVVGRAGRAFVDLDGLAVYPVFNTGRAARYQLNDFNALVQKSRTLRLYSGLVRLVLHVSTELTRRLGEGDVLDYVLRHPNVWSDKAVIETPASGGDEDEQEKPLDQFVADLDVALLSLVEPLDVPTDSLVQTLDSVLTGSLWQRTLDRVSELQRRTAEIILQSRAVWLWNNTTVEQRRACFNSGLGQRSGVFLHEHLDELSTALAAFQNGIIKRSAETAAEGAVAFATGAFRDPFFAPRTPPAKWQNALRGWVSGRPFAEVAQNSDVHTFIQESVVFKLVWAAEAVRVQALALEHPTAGALGDGPAMSLTFGVPNLQAALLCQMGFASRVGAMYVVDAIAADFTDMPSLRRWVSQYSALLSDTTFWATPEHHLLWTTRGTFSNEPPPTTWERRKFRLAVKWNGRRPAPTENIRVVPLTRSTGMICSEHLEQLGSWSESSVSLAETYVEGTVSNDGSVMIQQFGPGR
jgi:hypothetical protein